jgi:tetratricopeptide (TPR) repeat protein
MDAQARTSLGWIRLATWDWAAAEQEFEKAIELNPGHADAHSGYGLYLRSIGQQDEGLAEAKRALELDPLSLQFNAEVATHLLHLGRYDEAIEQCMETLALEPGSPRGRITLFTAYNQKGMEKEALEEAKKTSVLMSGTTQTAEAMDEGYAKSGFEGAMLAAAQKLEERSRQKYVKPLWIAGYYAIARHNDEALHWLEKAYAERDFLLTALKIAKTWDFLRSDPRFQDIMRRMNFPE